jgi:hypothetical protein
MAPYTKQEFGVELRSQIEDFDSARISKWAWTRVIAELSRLEHGVLNTMMQVVTMGEGATPAMSEHELLLFAERLIKPILTKSVPHM